MDTNKLCCTVVVMFIIIILMILDNRYYILYVSNEGKFEYCAVQTSHEINADLFILSCMD